MGNLLDLLKAAAGESSLHGALGRWRRAVSSELDKLLSSTFILVRRASTDQSVDFSAEDDVVLNSVVEDGGVAYDASTGVFTLEAGLYELEFHGTWINFGTPDTTAATVQWVSHPTGAALETGLTTWVTSASSVKNEGSQPVAKVLYRSAAGAQVKVKANAAGGGGTADLLRGSSYAVVRKIG
jgi:hypothetical protein